MVGVVKVIIMVGATKAIIMAGGTKATTMAGVIRVIIMAGEMRVTITMVGETTMDGEGTSSVRTRLSSEITLKEFHGSRSKEKDIRDKPII